MCECLRGQCPNPTLPAMGGPTVMGTDIMPRRKPMACDTFWEPTSVAKLSAVRVYDGGGEGGQ